MERIEELLYKIDNYFIPVPYPRESDNIYKLLDEFQKEIKRSGLEDIVKREVLVIIEQMRNSIKRGDMDFAYALVEEVGAVLGQ